MDTRKPCCPVLEISHTNTNTVHRAHCNKPDFKRYTDVMNARGVVVMGLDMQGHGHSEGERALALSHEHLVDDICQFIHHVYEDDLTNEDCRLQCGENLDLTLLQSLRALPFFLMGSSMGGGKSIIYLKTKGVMFSSHCFHDNSLAVVLHRTNLSSSV